MSKEKFPSIDKHQIKPSEEKKAVKRWQDSKGLQLGDDGSQNIFWPMKLIHELAAAYADPNCTFRIVHGKKEDGTYQPIIQVWNESGTPLPPPSGLETEDGEDDVLNDDIAGLCPPACDEDNTETGSSDGTKITPVE